MNRIAAVLVLILLAMLPLHFANLTDFIKQRRMASSRQAAAEAQKVREHDALVQAVAAERHRLAEVGLLAGVGTSITLDHNDNVELELRLPGMVTKLDGRDLALQVIEQLQLPDGTYIFVVVRGPAGTRIASVNGFLRRGR